MPRLFVDNLTAIDCSILDPERGLIGASWAVNIELEGQLDKQSMVFDFAKVKKIIKTIIDQEVDHKLLLPIQYAGLSVQGNDPIKLDFISRRHEKISHLSPAQAVCLIETATVDEKSVCAYLKNKILAELPNNIEDLQLCLEPESADGYYYCYSHGLKKHDGNCQRIAHGHRSQIQIWKNGTREAKLERALAHRWQDIYLGSEDDLLSSREDVLTFGYHTDQGVFELALEKHRVHLMPCDSTVECIAEHIVDLFQDEGGDIRVKAFEGIGKGALAAKV